MQEIYEDYNILVTEVHSMTVEQGTKMLDSFLAKYPNHNDYGIKKNALEDLKGELYLLNERDELALIHYRQTLFSLSTSDDFYPIILLRYVKITEYMNRFEEGLNLIEDYFKKEDLPWGSSQFLLSWYAQNCDAVGADMTNLFMREVQQISKGLGFPIFRENLKEDIKILLLEDQLASRRYLATLMIRNVPIEEKRTLLKAYLANKYDGNYGKIAVSALTALDSH